jgi:hypothetical protein
MLGAWDLIHDKWEHVGGSIAICENHWKVENGNRSLVNWDTTNYTSHPPCSYYLTNKGHTGETCGSAFWIKFNQRLHLEGRIHYHAKMEGTKGTVGIAILAVKDRVPGYWDHFLSIFIRSQLMAFI